MYHHSSAHWRKAHICTHACGCTYVSSSPGAFRTCCDRDTAWSKPNIRTRSPVWTEEAWHFPHHTIILCIGPFTAREAVESVNHVNILFSRCTFISVQLRQRYSQQGQLLRKCPQKRSAPPVIGHCIIISQSRGSIHGALCGSDLGNKQVHKCKTMTPQTLWDPHGVLLSTTDDNCVVHV